MPGDVKAAKKEGAFFAWMEESGEPGKRRRAP
jgi:hypothetical protein